MEIVFMGRKSAVRVMAGSLAFNYQIIISDILVIKLTLISFVLLHACM